MELSKIKYLQRYMTSFELEYINFERNPQRHQLLTIFKFTIEEVFETLEISDAEMTTAHY